MAASNLRGITTEIRSRMRENEMARDEAGLPTEEEIVKLSRRAIVAFATRCARRVQPLFSLTWPDSPKKNKEAVENAIQLAGEMESVSQKYFVQIAPKTKVAAIVTVGAADGLLEENIAG